MGFKCGIVGLPNVGKSTLFNALTRTAAAQAANFPFCTIEPNVGEVSVPDDRLDTLAGIAQSKEVIPTRLTFVDIAGLVKGASRGEGLGNQFLANIRETDAIAHVLRCFEDDDITHVDGRIDPLADADVIETELMLADLESVEKRLAGLVRKLKSGDKDAGGMMAMGPEHEGVPPHWMVYLSVADCDATVAKAQETGGKVLVPPMDTPVGRFACLMDPQGAAFSVITLTNTDC